MFLLQSVLGLHQSLPLVARHVGPGAAQHEREEFAQKERFVIAPGLSRRPSATTGPAYELLEVSQEPRLQPAETLEGRSSLGHEALDRPG